MTATILVWGIPKTDLGEWRAYFLLFFHRIRSFYHTQLDKRRFELPL